MLPGIPLNRGCLCIRTGAKINQTRCQRLVKQRLGKLLDDRIRVNPVPIGNKTKFANFDPSSSRKMPFSTPYKIHSEEVCAFHFYF